MVTVVTQKHFIIDASQQRVWRLLGSAIFQSLPLEQMNAINQTTFYAVFRWRLGFISIPLDFKGRIVDVIEPDSLGAIIRVKKGIMQ